MEEREPFKIKFTTVLIIIFVLFAIIGILAFNFERTNSVLKQIANNNTNNGNTNLGASHTSVEPNDYNFFSENYRESLKEALANEEKSLSILKNSSGTLLQNGIASIELDALGDVYLNINQSSPLYGKYGKITKVASNVLDFEICDLGQNTVIYFMHNDGTVSELNTYETPGEISTNTISSISEIVKIITVPYNDSIVPAFVDINGFIYTVNGEAF